MSTYTSFPYYAHIHGEDTSPATCWPLPKGARHRRGVSTLIGKVTIGSSANHLLPSGHRHPLSLPWSHSTPTSRPKGLSLPLALEHWLPSSSTLIQQGRMQSQSKPSRHFKKYWKRTQRLKYPLSGTLCPLSQPRSELPSWPIYLFEKWSLNQRAFLISATCGQSNGKKTSQYIHYAGSPLRPSTLLPLLPLYYTFDHIAARCTFHTSTLTVTSSMNE